MYQYTVTFGEAISRAFSKYCCFTGRASRSEFWWFFLFSWLIGMICGFGTGMFKIVINPNASDPLGESMFSIVIGLIFLLPSLGLAWRRLHDIGKGGGWYVIGLIPIIGQILLIIWFCRGSEPGDNRFGPVPNMRRLGE